MPQTAGFRWLQLGIAMIGGPISAMLTTSMTKSTVLP